MRGKLRAPGGSAARVHRQLLLRAIRSQPKSSQSTGGRIDDPSSSRIEQRVLKLTGRRTGGHVPRRSSGGAVDGGGRAARRRVGEARGIRGTRAKAAALTRVLELASSALSLSLSHGPDLVEVSGPTQPTTKPTSFSWAWRRPMEGRTREGLHHRWVGGPQRSDTRWPRGAHQKPFHLPRYKPLSLSLSPPPLSVSLRFLPRVETSRSRRRRRRLSLGLGFSSRRREPLPLQPRKVRLLFLRPPSLSLAISVLFCFVHDDRGW